MQPGPSGTPARVPCLLSNQEDKSLPLAPPIPPPHPVKNTPAISLGSLSSLPKSVTRGLRKAAYWAVSCITVTLQLERGQSWVTFRTTGSCLCLSKPSIEARLAGGLQSSSNPSLGPIPQVNGIGLRIQTQLELNHNLSECNSTPEISQRPGSIRSHDLQELMAHSASNQ